MSDRVNFGLIGCGEIAAQTSRAILESANARVVHCMDLVADLAADLAGKHGAKSTAHLDDLLADRDVQAVIVSTPHYMHAPLTVQAARAGKHVLSEKPMACTLSQADEMIAAAAAAGVKLGVLFPARLAFPYRKAAELLAGGAVGQVLAVKLHGMGNKPAGYWAGGWTGRVKTDWRPKLATSGGGFLIMNQIHDLDMVVGLLGLRPTRIYAEYGTFRTPVEVEDFLSFVMRTESGTLVSLDGASAAIGVAFVLIALGLPPSSQNKVSAFWGYGSAALLYVLSAFWLGQPLLRFPFDHALDHQSEQSQQRQQ